MGFWMLYACSLNLVSALVSFIQMIQTRERGHFAISGALMLLNAGLYLFIAWLLIFRTDWVADKVRVQRGGSSHDAQTQTTLLPVGIRLIGLYILLMAIPALVYLIIDSPHTQIVEQNPGWGIEAVISGIPLVIQIFLSTTCVIKPNHVMKFIANGTEAKWPKIIAIILLAVGFLVLLGRGLAMQKYAILP